MTSPHRTTPHRNATPRIANVGTWLRATAPKHRHSSSSCCRIVTQLALLKTTLTTSAAVGSLPPARQQHEQSRRAALLQAFRQARRSPTTVKRARRRQVQARSILKACAPAVPYTTLRNPSTTLKGRSRSGLSDELTIASRIALPVASNGQ